MIVWVEFCLETCPYSTGNFIMQKFIETKKDAQAAPIQLETHPTADT